MNAAFYRILPVDIDTVENAGSLNSISKMAGNEGLHAGANEIAQMVRLGRAGESFRLSPATEGDKNFQVWKKMLQLLQLMKSSAQLVWTLRISAAIYAGSSIVFMAQRHLTIRDLALIVRDATKSIIEMRQQIRRSACRNTFNRILSRRSAALSEIANHLAFVVF